MNCMEYFPYRIQNAFFLRLGVTVGGVLVCVCFIFLVISNVNFIQLRKKSHPSMHDLYNWGPIQSSTQITSIRQSVNQENRMTSYN